MDEKEHRYSSLNIRLMIALIAVLLIGIILRRDFIVSELKATFDNMFPATDTASNATVQNSAE